MKWLFGVEVIFVLTILRLVVPVLIMFLLAYALHRLEARWQAPAQNVSHPLSPAAGD